MRLSFDSIDEVRDFVKGLKGTRGGKGGDADDSGGQGQQTGQQIAPPPLAPPAGAAAFGGFPGAGQAFPGATAPTLAPEVLALVNRINTRIDAVIAGGQPADQALTWFRGHFGPEAAGATMDQIKQVFLPKAPMPMLENIAKLIAA